MSSKSAIKTQTTERKLKISMPQMAFKGLSEHWLFKELGDMHWAMISKAFNTASNSIVDSSGDRLYASFLRIRLESSAALGFFNENDEITLKGELKRFGEKMFFSDTVLNSGSKTIKSSLMSMFVARKTDNKKLARAAPVNSAKAEVEALAGPSPFAGEYLSLKQKLTDQSVDDSPEISLGREAFETGREIIFSTDYQIEPYHDLNGVNLLYFASYPRINDICERRYFHLLGEQLGFEEDWSLQTAVLARDVWYFGNCDIDDEIVFQINYCRFIEDRRVKIGSSLIRKRDNFLMAKIFTIKQLAAQKTAYKNGFSQLWDMKNSELSALVAKPDKKKIVRILTGLLGAILGIKKDELGEKSDLKSLNLESVVLTEFSEQLASKHRLFINPSRFYEFSDFGELADYFVDGGKKKSGVTVKPKLISDEKEIAVIGISGRFPQAENPAEFWNNLIQGKDCVSEIPSERWDWRRYYGDPFKESGKSNSKWGGFLEKAEEFDAEFFNISPREAELMDPQQRLLLEETWHAMEDAGYRPSDLAGSDGGVFVGICHNDYHDLLEKHSEWSEFYQTTGTSFSIAANRVSYLFDLRGPSLAVDTACSSSLVAIHQAVESLIKGECSMALAGGVNLCLSPKLFCAYSRAGMLSPGGRCKTFDKRADGYVRGEGAGVILLKPLSKAIADKDRIYGVIKGSAVNHGGQVSSLTVPNPNAQAELIAKAHQESGFPPESVGYIECHGTGTSLGDPIEVNGLKMAFADIYRKCNTEPPNDARCALGSVKSNIGHLEAAAGVVGVIKTLLAFQHKKLPGNLHFEDINPYIELENTPFYVASDSRDWRPLKDKSGVPFPLRAGVSSFGFGGANAHVVLEGYQTEVPSTKFGSPYLIILSAKNKERLKVYTQNLIRFLEESDEEVSLPDLSYTLQIGREVMERRLALLVDDKKELLSKLKKYLENGAETSGLYLGDVESKKAETDILISGNSGKLFIKAAIEDKEFGKLARLWTNGLKIDWNLLYGELKPRKISLPVYPFAKERYWIPEEETKIFDSTREAVSALHPLIDVNSSTLEEQSFEKELRKDQFYLKDHRVKQQKTLPAAAYLEMARAAGDLASQSAEVRTLRNLVWSQPIIVNDKPQKIKISLSPENEKLLFQVASQGERNTVYSQGELDYRTPAFQPPNEDLAEIKKRRSSVKTKSEYYQALDKSGLNYGPAFQVIESLSYNEKEALARLKLPDVLRPGFDRFGLHPSLLDGALQTTPALLKAEEGVFLPFSLKETTIFKPLSEEMFVYTTFSDPDSRAPNFDIKILGVQGEVLAVLKDFGMRALKPDRTKAAPENLYFEPVWQNEPVEEKPKSFSGRVLIFDRDETLLEALKEEFPGVDPILVTPGKSFMKKDGGYRIRTDEEKDYLALTESLLKDERSPSDILYISRALDAEAEKMESRFYGLFYLTKALMKIGSEEKIRFLYIYDNNSPRIYFDRAVAGLAKTVALERPRFLWQTLGLDDLSNPKKVLSKAVGEPSDNVRAEVRHIEETRQVKVLKEFQPRVFDPGRSPLKKEGVYLISGGLGALGLVTARRLAAKYQAGLILTGRSELTEEKEKTLSELKDAGAKAVYFPADISDLKDAERLIEEAKGRFGEINGVIHCAGVTKDSLILNKTEAEIKSVTASKVRGTLNLDQVLKDERLDFMIFFSSIAGALGNVGQADYAFANAFLDNFAQNRQKLVDRGERFGLTISVNWPYWNEGGMYMDQSNLKWMENVQGLTPLSDEQGLNFFEESLTLGKTQLLVAQGQAGRFKKSLEVAAVKKEEPSLFSPDGAEKDRLIKKTADWLKKLLSTELKLKPERVKVRDSWEKYGIDSLMIVNLTRRLEQDLGELSKTIFFENQNIEQLSLYLVENHPQKLPSLTGLEEESPSGVKSGEKFVDEISPQPFKSRFSLDPVMERQASSESDEIAIIGLSGRYPQANDLNEFWRNLKEGRDCITEIPAERWDWRKYYDPDKDKKGFAYSKWGSFLDGVGMFDPLFFNISPREARRMDPQERLFLETVWHALEDGGYSKSSLSGSKTGVFAGAMWGEYQLLSLRGLTPGEEQFGNSFYASIANRISYFFNFQGPSFAVDSMCSSSLTAIHLACESLKRGESELAVAGGVNLSLDPHKYLLLSQDRFIAAGGRCRSFGVGGDGYVPGEGVGAVVLKPLRRAVEDNDQIYGVIKGAALNHGGKTAGYTVPNPLRQGNLIGDALKAAGVEPDAIGYIEAHGTGTSLGDPIEINGLNRAFGKENGRQYCAVGSVKSNIGHLESAAGIAALTKVLLQLKHKRLVPSIHSETLNPAINFEDSPFYVQRELSEWRPRPLKNKGEGFYPRLAGISSFGAGGANAHLIIEEHRPKPKNEAAEIRLAGPRPVVLSAKNETSLKIYVQKMTEFLEKHFQTATDFEGADFSLTDLAYTLQIGREAMEERLALTVNSKKELLDKLKNYLKTGAASDGLYSGNINKEDGEAELLAGDEETSELIDILIKKRKLDKLARLWAGGAEIDWKLLYGELKPQKISLPVYPFQRKNYWINSDFGDSLKQEEKEVKPQLDDSREEKELNTDLHTSKRISLKSAASQKGRSNSFKERDIPRLKVKLKNNGEKISDNKIFSAKSAESRPKRETPRKSSRDGGLLKTKIMERIKRELSEVSMIDISEIKNDAPFGEMGLDSVLMTELLGRLKGFFKINFSAAKLYDYPTVESLSEYMASGADVLEPDSGSEAAATEFEKVRLPSESAENRPNRETLRKSSRDGDLLKTKIMERIKMELSEVSMIDISEIKNDAPFGEMGLDSVLMAELLGRLKEHFKINFSAAKLYDYPTVKSLSEYMASEAEVLEPDSGPKAAASEFEKVRLPLKKDSEKVLENKPSKTRSRWREDFSSSGVDRTKAPSERAGDIAVIGMSSRFPEARNTKEFWKNLAAGRNSISEVPPERWDRREYYDPDPQAPGKTYCEHGGFLEDVDKFDPMFFNISPAEAELMDPQQRLFLEESWKALEDAAYSPSSLNGLKCGVYAGVLNNDYERILIPKKLAFSPTSEMLGSSRSILAGRIAYFLNLKGAALAIDTACSSSLVAVHLACLSLLKGEMDMALAGGVTLYLSEESYIMMSKAGMLSAKGRCGTFDDEADGFVPGEGVGVVVLKTLAKAVEDGDRIYGVIKGSGMNQDGKTSGITAPSSESQKKLELEVYGESGINPETITYVEAHGTGTELGDPIEVEGLNASFGEYTEKKQYCAIGSVKTNIGHTSAAAGAAGIIKILMSMKHKKIPPSLNYNTCNRHIDFAGTPFYVNTELKDWNPGNLPRRAAVSSFGFSGTNVHLVLEEYRPPERISEPKSPPPYLTVMSTKNEKGLKAYARKMIRFLEQYSEAGKPSAPKTASESDLLNLLSEIVEIPAAELDAEVSFEEQGCDQLHLNAMAAAVSEKYGLELSSSIFIDRPSLASLRVYLEDKLLENRVSRRGEERLSLTDLAYTTQVGRGAMEERLAVIAGDETELLDKLKKYIDRGAAEDGLYSGRAGESKIKLITAGEEGEEFLATIIRKGNLDKLALLWTSGVDIDWTLLYGKSAPRKISAPTYPFAKERCWIPEEKDGKKARIQTLHPLIDANVSDFQEQAFEKEFAGSEFYLTDHRIRGGKILPGAIYTEMARAAAELADRKAPVCGLKNLVWLRPLKIEDKAEKVKISLRPENETIFWRVADAENPDTIYSQGEIGRPLGEENDASRAFDSEEIRKRCSQSVSGADFYRKFQKRGAEYGPAFQTIERVYYNESEVLAHLKPPEFLKSEFDRFGLHPSLLDGALQAAAALLPPEENALFLPAGLKELEILKPLNGAVYAYVTFSGNFESEEKNFDIKLVNGEGETLVRLKDFSVRAAQTFQGEKTENFYFEPVWKKAAGGEESKDFSSPVLMFSENEALFKAFEDGHSEVELIAVRQAEAFMKEESGFRIRPNSEEDCLALIENLTKNRRPPRNIVYFSSALEPEKRFYSLFYLTKALIKAGVKEQVRLLYLYRNASDQVCFDQAAGGLFKTARLENPRFIFQTMGLDDLSDSEDVAAKVLKELRLPVESAEVGYFGDERRIRVTEELKPEKFSEGESPLKKGGVYLITGGLGGLGLITARYLATKYRAKLVLAGRSDLTPEKKEQLLSLKKTGGQAVYIKADVSAPKEAEKLIRESKERFGKINGVVHGAGLIRDSLILNKTEEEIKAVFAPKIHGVLNINSALKDEKLDFTVFFSSVAGILGNPGQTDYAYASAFLDSLAEKFERTVSINWPYWAEGGMRIDKDELKHMESERGLLPLSAEQGMKFFEESLASGKNRILPARGRADKFRESLKAADIKEERLFTDLNEAEKTRLRTETGQWLKKVLADELKLKPERIRERESWENYGIDSMKILSLTRRLEEDLGELPKTLFFENRVLEELSLYLAENHPETLSKLTGLKKTEIPAAPHEAAYEASPRISRSRFSVSENTEKSAPGVEKVAVIGLSGRYPMANDLEEFWRNLKEGRDCVSEVPAERWDWREYHNPDRTRKGFSHSRWGGFLEGVDLFDPVFFNISPREAKRSDPQERLFLETAWRTLEDAGYSKSTLSGSNTGVFVGIMWGEYQLLGARGLRPGQENFSGSSYASAANRVSYFFDWRGPSMALDSMCSSSLTAVHLACRSLLSGESELALAGGVNLSLDPYKYLLLSENGFASSDGRCRSFGKGGDGYVPGEGVGAVLLKPLRQAVRDNDHIYGIISGSSLNHGGKTAGYTVPNPKAQGSVISGALKSAGVKAESLTYIEAHGTGTSLGDPIEISGLKRAFEKETDKKRYCSIGSVKSNIGHLESAAGVAALSKVLLQMKHRQLAPSIHSEELNPHIDFENSPFHIQRELCEWTPKDGSPLRAGISSFGAGGANAHLIVEEHREDKNQGAVEINASTPCVIVLSAVNQERLKIRAQNLAEFLENRAEDNAPSLTDLAYTLQLRGDAMEERLAFSARDREELLLKLRDYLKNGAQSADVYTGNIHKDGGAAVSGEQPAEQSAANMEPEKLARLWANGAEIDWKPLYGDARPRRIALPGYPFVKKRCWISSDKMKSADQLNAKTKDDASKKTTLNKTPKIRLNAAQLNNRPSDEAPSRHLSPLTVINGQRHSAITEKRLKEVYPELEAPESQPFQLKLSEYGLLQNLYLKPLVRREPRAGEVEIEVEAAALNYRDVLIALGMLKDYYSERLGVKRAEDLNFGFECSGRITRLGDGVSGFKAGDRVMAAMAHRTMRSFATLPADCVAPKPSSLSVEEAAATPVAFLTAYYGLERLAGIRPEDKVLIHAAAGGVGMAAAQIAALKGAEIFATAGESKHSFLKSLGIKHIMNSRGLDFASEIMDVTQGGGVDVALNSISGDAIHKSLEVMKKGGKFVEIGKRGILSKEEVKNIRPDISYMPFDLNEEGRKKPALISGMFKELSALFDDGKLRPLPCKVFSVRETARAFAYLQRSLHIGRVIISFTSKNELKKKRK